LCSKGDSPSTNGLPSQEGGSPNSLHLSAEQSANFADSSSVQTAPVKYLTYLTSQLFT